jgi:hypothetical protein
LVDNANYQVPALTSAGYLFPSGGDPKLNPAFGDIRARLWDNDAWYHGLQAGVTKKLSFGLQVQGSFSLSKCEDTGSNLAFSDPYQNSLPDYFYFDHRITKGLCDFNGAKSGVISLIYTIPTIRGDSRFESKILGGWQVGAIVTDQSGSPFTPVIAGDPYSRAQGDANMGYVDLVPGCNPISSNWKAAGPHGLQYLNLNCLTAPALPNMIGNLGRNQIVGPRLFDMDFSIFKNLRVTERISTQLRVEMFNILNHPNFLPPLDNLAIRNPDGSVAGGNAGVVDQTSTDPRQIQFGMKIIF